MSEVNRQEVVQHIRYIAGQASNSAEELSKFGTQSLGVHHLYSVSLNLSILARILEKEIPLPLLHNQKATNE